MGIFDINSNTANDLTRAKVDSFKRKSISSLKTLKANITDLFNMAWTPTNGVSIQKFWYTLGVDSADAISKSAATQLFSKSIDPSWVFLVPKYEYVLNQDGTLTVGNLIQESENLNG